MLDQLERIAAGRNPDVDGKELPRGLAAGLDLRKVGIFGFSLGGYATANTLLEDKRFAAGLDLDGTLQDDPAKGPLGEVARKGLDQPFLLFGSDTSQRTTGKEHLRPVLAAFWDAQRGWKLDLQVLAGAKQQAFTDTSSSSQLPPSTATTNHHLGDDGAGRRGRSGPQCARQRRYLSAFFDQTLRPGPTLLAETRRNSRRFASPADRLRCHPSVADGVPSGSRGRMGSGRALGVVRRAVSGVVGYFLKPCDV